jgi:biotin carboxylase
VDLCDPEGAAAAIVELAADHPLDAVVAVDDQGVEAAARAAAALGLAASPVAAVQLTRDKVSMRRALAASGIAQPRFAVLGAGEDPAVLMEESGLAWPVVVKPVGLSASRGVIRADGLVALRRAIGRIEAILAESGGGEGSDLLVEEFVPGPELAVEGLVRAGRLEVVAVFDKPDPLDGPYFEETLYVTPSRAPHGDLAAVEELVAGAVHALGLTHGPVHAEARLGPQGPRLLEVAARSIGGLCSRALRFGAGISLEQLILAAAVGVDLGDRAPTRAASGVMMIPIPAAGRLLEVHGLPAAREVPHVSGVEITVPLGSLVRPLPEGNRYLGFLFASADTPAEVEAALRAGHRQLRFDIESSPVPA